MFYEEKTINGVLMCRNTPKGEWREVSVLSTTKLCRRVGEMCVVVAEGKGSKL